MAHEHHEHHESHAGTYFLVFLALCLFTAMSVVADMVELADKNVLRVIVLAIATAKALCVMLFFMHLKFERAWKYLLLVPTFILASALPFALMPDVGIPYYVPEAPQRKEYARLLAAEASAGHHASDHHAAPQDHPPGEAAHHPDHPQKQAPAAEQPVPQPGPANADAPANTSEPATSNE